MPTQRCVVRVDVAPVPHPTRLPDPKSCLHAAPLATGLIHSVDRLWCCKARAYACLQAGALPPACCLGHQNRH